jgi:hypothetical protein
MEIRKHAIILEVIQNLSRLGSRTGKTHIQKALSLLRDTNSMDIPFQFILYKHGPFSFDVVDELEQMQSYDAIQIEPNQEGYGVVLSPGSMCNYVRTHAPLEATELHAIQQTCEFVGNRNVLDLERLATASWIRYQEQEADPENVAARLHELKPHIALADARIADQAIRQWRN